MATAYDGGMTICGVISHIHALPVLFSFFCVGAPTNANGAHGFRRCCAAVHNGDVVGTFSSNTGLFATATAASAAVRDRDLQADVLLLFDELRDRLLRYAMSLGLSVHDGEDVLQEVFLALFRHLQADKSRENLPGWAYRTTHNLSLRRRAALHTELRRTGPDAHDDRADSALLRCADAMPTPEAQVMFSERQQRLRAVVRALPESDRACLQLRADGCRYREIASIVGISLGSVAASLARTFDKLQRMDAR